MKNNQILPFERNRYYSGKMLSSSDFIIEQTYHNNKRHFINQMMFGSGIICGLSVYNLDDLSLMVDSGAAMDACGREIIVDNTIIEKLSAVRGYDELETNKASLCIRYAEEPVHEVYVAAQEGKENEFNHVDEGYELYLVDSEKTGGGFFMESEFLLRGNLADTDDYTLEISVPAVVCMGKPVKILFVLTKRSDKQTEFIYQSVLQMPLFFSADGKHEAEVCFKDNSLEKGESIVQEIWVQVQNFPTEEANIIVKPDSVKMLLNGAEQEADASFFLTLIVADINPRDLVDRELGKTSLEMRSMTEQTDYVKLADITFKRTDSGGVIQKIEEQKAKKYIEAPSDGALRSEYLGYYAMYTPAEKTAAVPESENRQDTAFYNGPLCSSGSFEIPLGKGAKKGEVFYTGEIIHSLGRGNVYVQIGYEVREMDAYMNNEINTIIYGTSDIFSSKNQVPHIESAVKVLQDKGTFIGGIRFLKNYDKMILRCHWTAIQMPIVSQNRDFEDVRASIAPERPTIQLAPKESCFFPVKFVNMEACHLCYELSESGSGEISDNGVYTAPDKEGVFEIHIFCASNPFICTYAYALVKAKQGDANGV